MNEPDDRVEWTNDGFRTTVRSRQFGLGAVLYVLLAVGLGLGAMAVALKVGDLTDHSSSAGIAFAVVAMAGMGAVGVGVTVAIGSIPALHAVLFPSRLTTLTVGTWHMEVDGIRIPVDHIVAFVYEAGHEEGPSAALVLRLRDGDLRIPCAGEPEPYVRWLVQQVQALLDRHQSPGPSRR